MATWYAIRPKPAGSRLAPATDIDEPRKFRIEAQLERAGIEHYYPSETKFLRHHRTREWFERRFPLMGYVFVADVTDWPRLERDVRDSFGPVRLASAPVRIPAWEIERARAAQLQIDTGHALAHRNRQLTKRRLAELYPAGTPIDILEGPLASQQATVLFATGRQAIKAVIAMLGSEVTVELGIDQIRKSA